jgi:aminoglycoside phosphotransferase (APT) family kinase protein
MRCSDWAVGQVEKDQQWLPALAPQLPLAIPELLATGAPSDAYPWVWGVYRWLEGETFPADRVGEALHAASDLARFLLALRQIDTRGGPTAGRGGPLAARDTPVRRAIVALGDRVDADAVTGIWEAALQAAEWDEPPAWLHGDLMPGNLLFVEGRLNAIIDFSVLGVGDPATDLMVAWWFLTAETRPLFRAELAVDDASWMRGRGWALSCALIALPYYWETNPTFASYARRTLAEVLGDHG